MAGRTVTVAARPTTEMSAGVVVAVRNHRRAFVRNVYPLGGENLRLLTGA